MTAKKEQQLHSKVEARLVKCPTCGKPSVFSPENPARPFCSERCRLIDLGDWAEGKFAIAAGPVDDQELNDELLKSVEAEDDESES
jgi:endogenous inhibitor of DNA gyrase (YacG/DUF329 family)